MVKKLITILMCSVMAFSLVACGSSTEQTFKSNEDTKTEANQKESEAETKTEEKKEESIVLVDNEYATITYTGADKNAVMGPTLKLLVENKSDKNIIVQTDGVSADDMMANVSCSIDVVSGKKAKGDLILMDADKEFKKVEGTLKIISDDFITNYAEVPFSIEVK